MQTALFPQNGRRTVRGVRLNKRVVDLAFRSSDKQPCILFVGLEERGIIEIDEARVVAAATSFALLKN